LLEVTIGRNFKDDENLDEERFNLTPKKILQIQNKILAVNT
jgi:hypothetical protein